MSTSNLRDVHKLNNQFLKLIDDYHSDEILILMMGNSDNLKLNTKFKLKNWVTSRMKP